MKNRKRKHNTRKNKIVALLLEIIALFSLVTGDGTAWAFLTFCFVLPLLLSKENIIMNKKGEVKR